VFTEISGHVKGVVLVSVWSFMNVLLSKYFV